MPLDPRAKRLLDMLALSSPPPEVRLSLAARRDGFAKLMQMGAKPVAIGAVRDITVNAPQGPLPVRLYEPAGVEGVTPLLVFFHGGGLVAGSIETHDNICRRLAVASGVKVMSVDYRLAPEAKFPACLEDAGFASSWVGREAASLGMDATRLAIGGDSVGAMLATLIGNGYCPVPVVFKAQLLLCPVIDLIGDFPSRREFARGFLADADIVARDIDDCLGENTAPADLPSPLRMGEPGRSPSTIIISAECDPFRDEAAVYAQALVNAGVPVWHKCYPGMVHCFMGLGALLPQADAALDEVGQQLAEMLG